ncbi:MAG: DUF1553 domain-containing protein [Proteobacteria bacterium]|nr:DUF1553 domain-containing protein [Pseudomonadota bacterium]
MMAAIDMGTKLGELLKNDDKRRKAVGNLVKYHFGDAIWETNLTRWARLPKDYQYTDGKAGDVVHPRVLLGEQPEIDESPRRAFAKWIATADNPWFAKVLANRLWKKTMGVGLIEPIDEMTYATEGNMPGLLSELAYQLEVMHFNMKDFLRVLEQDPAISLKHLIESSRQRTASRIARWRTRCMWPTVRPDNPLPLARPCSSRVL